MDPLEIINRIFSPQNNRQSGIPNSPGFPLWGTHFTNHQQDQAALEWLAFINSPEVNRFFMVPGNHPNYRDWYTSYLNNLMNQK